jgi:hypothetical protein
MTRSILAMLIVFLVTGGWEKANAQSKENVYSNKFIGLTFSVPEAWYVVTDDEVKRAMPDAKRVMGLDDPSVKAIVDQMPGMMLLVVSEHPFSSEIEGGNQNILIAAINFREMKGEISSAKEFLENSAKGVREAQPSAILSDILKQPLGGEDFYRFDVSFQLGGMTIHASQFARICNDYILIVNLTGDSDSEKGLNELVKIVDGSMKFHSVSEEVDRSSEGISFRKKSSVKIGGSSGGGSSSGETLRIGGGLLIAFGIFLVLKSIIK